MYQQWKHQIQTGNERNVLLFVFGLLLMQRVKGTHLSSANTKPLQHYVPNYQARRKKPETVTISWP